ncbi:MAG: hypothetical protein RBS80_28435 [Thermoguttaceae bacterium]|nr:hypothetical protein [Thermoguttaceae bacterium]
MTTEIQRHALAMLTVVWIRIVRLAVLGGLLSGFPLAVLAWCICR